MSNRGTGPSWDEEEIRKYGLQAHLRNTHVGRELRKIHGLAVQRLGAIMALLPKQNPEAHARAEAASLAVARRVVGLRADTLGDSRGTIAGEIYLDCRKRVQIGCRRDFKELNGQEQAPFYEVVDAAIKVHTTVTS